MKIGNGPISFFYFYPYKLDIGPFMKVNYKFLAVFVLMAGCSQSKKDETAICMVNRAPLYETADVMNPSDKDLILGEEITIADKDFERKNDNEFVFITLSDGSAKWTAKRNLLPGAIPAAVIRNTKTYRETDTSVLSALFHLAEFVAITETKDEFAKITSVGKEKSGWTLKTNISAQDHDVEIAVLAQEELLDKNHRIIDQLLPNFLTIVPDKQSLLARELQKQLDFEVSDAIEESIRQYESNQGGYNQ